MEPGMAKTNPSPMNTLGDELADAIVARVEKHDLLCGGVIMYVSDGVWSIDYTTIPGKAIAKRRLSAGRNLRPGHCATKSCTGGP
jgi:hypothetical protein